MQKFRVMLEITINTVESVSELDVRQEVESLVEDFESGNIVVKEIDEE